MKLKSEEFTIGKLKFLNEEANVSDIIANKTDGTSNTKNSFFKEHSVKILNGRKNLKEINIEKNGFCLVHFKTEVQDLFDDDLIEKVYEKEVRTLLFKTTNCDEILIQNHTRRTSEKSKNSFNKPALTVHNDYTNKSMLTKLKKHIKDNNIQLDIESYSRIAIVIIWRSCKGIIKSYPLALCDIRTVEKGQILNVTRLSDIGKNEVQLAKFNKANKWYYFPNMTLNEAIMFKSADSAINTNEHSVLHSSFDLQCEKENNPRFSLESRCFIFYK